MTDIAIIIACIAATIYFIARARKLWHEANEIRMRNAERAVAFARSNGIGLGAGPQ